MIVACPECEAKYRVDPARVGPGGARLRCAKCQSIFRVDAPAAPPATVQPEPVQPAAAPAPSPPLPAPAPTPVAPAAAPPQASAPDPERMVLVADSEADVAKAIASALTSWGLAPVVVLDGVEAMLSIQRLQPRVVVLDAALTKMYGFQVCEIVKRNESLRSIKVVLAGAIHDVDRYRRAPVELYGADVYLEKPDLPDALLPCLRQFGMPVPDDLAEPGPAAPPISQPPMPQPVAPPPQPAPTIEAPAPAPTPSPPAPMPIQPPTVAAPPQPAPAEPAAAPDPELAAQHEAAERLARIIVSDIILYNPEKFEAALRAGNVAEALEPDLAEGRKLFGQRVDERVRGEKDHLREELLRVAREKGMP